MPKKNILIITGTRSDYGLLKPIIEGVLKSKILKLHLLVTGMHTLKKYGLTLKEIKKDKIPIAGFVPISEKDDMLSALAKELNGINKYCLNNRIDLVIAQGDRDEPFAGAIVAGHLGIPVAHIHGGDVTGPTVDEYIRHAITKFSHLHFTVSRKSRQRVIKLGEEKWRVFNVGAPGLDILRTMSYKNKGDLADQLNINPSKKWFLIVQHPTHLEKIGIKDQIVPTLAAIKSFDAEKIIIYPNSDSGSNVFIREINKYHRKEGFYIHKNLSRETYANLLKCADVLIGNSSSGILEAGYLKLPVVNIGNRQEDRECGQNVIHVGYNTAGIQTAIRTALSPKFKDICKKVNHPYGRGRAGLKIVTAIEENVKSKKLLNKGFTYAKTT